jgi:hypothetical protein
MMYKASKGNAYVMNIKANEKERLENFIHFVSL